MTNETRILVDAVRGILFRLQDCIELCLQDLQDVEAELTDDEEGT